MRLKVIDSPASTRTNRIVLQEHLHLSVGNRGGTGMRGGYSLFNVPVDPYMKMIHTPRHVPEAPRPTSHGTSRGFVYTPMDRSAS
ncbi:hypothetical protein JK2ML_0141 [Mycobacterium leprae Kyoto-2]|uniref:Uncharacterized protein n=3 Tax=Mycobacterium leprae TaxID=1769 RepID=Q9CD77_MYCLE|nr:hypothetical protein DIJ64_00735 [Mycobacterium leprae]OAR20692.1 hypothetical protein A8144_09635 [Mycobacterium leprae 3125609]OAX70438.1 hypothetical protein A3216_11965 [Mycobacterium leprae 7935681]CAR70234.1 hypothetical protein MLBr00141 [Mycobacterium leprae Br4923]BBC16396.1 hypothetical protein JK2ML_0141 [Mycobacterium leprae Kyoto-2]